MSNEELGQAPNELRGGGKRQRLKDETRFNWTQ